MIDGLFNSVVESDVVPLSEEESPAGNGFTTSNTTLTEEGGREWSYEKERRWKIVNPGKKHYASGENVGFSVGVKGGVTPLFAKANTSWVGKRAGFTQYVLFPLLHYFTLLITE